MLGKVFGSELSFTFGKYQHDPFPHNKYFLTESNTEKIKPQCVHLAYDYYQLKWKMTLINPNIEKG